MGFVAPRIPHLKEWKWNHSICLEVHPPLLRLSSLLPPGSPRLPVVLVHNNELMGGRRVTGARSETLFVLITSSWEALPWSPLKRRHCSRDALGFSEIRRELTARRAAELLIPPGFSGPNPKLHLFVEVLQGNPGAPRRICWSSGQTSRLCLIPVEPTTT